MDTEQQRLRSLYDALGSLEYHTSAAVRLDARSVDPGPLYDASEISVDRRHTQIAARRIASARAQADALARAEARLDAELVRRVFRLASKVLRAGKDITDKQELADAMRAFAAAVAAARRQYEPPADDSPIPRVAGAPPSVVAGLATKAQVDSGVAEASALLERVREVAVRQAQVITARVDDAEARNRALFGVVDAPARPSMVGALTERAAALDTSGAFVDRGDEIQAVRSGFDETMMTLADYRALNDGVASVRGRILSAETSAGNLAPN